MPPTKLAITSISGIKARGFIGSGICRFQPTIFPRAAKQKISDAFETFLGLNHRFGLWQWTRGY